MLGDPQALPRRACRELDVLRTLQVGDPRIQWLRQWLRGEGALKHRVSCRQLGSFKYCG